MEDVSTRLAAMETHYLDSIYNLGQHIKREEDSFFLSRVYAAAIPAVCLWGEAVRLVEDEVAVTR
jgi:hypothetical protein